MYTVEPLKFDPRSLKGISEKQITLHHDKHYAGYVKKRNEIMETLRKGPLQHMRELKKAESHNASGQILHETYFDNLGGKGGEPSGKLKKQMEKDFGSYGKWKKQFLACAAAARGWVLLCYDWSDGRLHNYIVDFHDQGAVWEAEVLIALDVWEHAYYLDYGPDKTGYIDAFFRNLDWKSAEEIFGYFAGKK